MARIPHPSTDASSPRLWLVLDEVVDPQNFGALLRSAYFLGGGGSGGGSNDNESVTSASPSIGIMVCAKNSAPPSPVVSAASAGALELCQVYSTSNLPRTLNAAKADGFRILGAAASAPTDDGTQQKTWELSDLNWEQDKTDDGKMRPTILVLGSEGHGLRTLVAKACTDFVAIPGGGGGVDSLNVSVTGGIMLWHLVNGMMAN